MADRWYVLKSDVSPREIHRVNPDNTTDTASPYGFKGRLSSSISRPNGMAWHPIRDTVLIIDYRSGQLWEMDPENPIGAKNIFKVTGNQGPWAIACLPDGSTYVMQSGNNLYLVDFTQKNASFVGQILGACSGMTGTPRGDLIGINLDGRLYLINPTNPPATSLLGHVVTPGGENFSALAASSYSLIGAENDGDEYWNINQSSPPNSRRYGAFPSTVANSSGMAIVRDPLRLSVGSEVVERLYIGSKRVRSLYIGAR